MLNSSGYGLYTGGMLWDDIPFPESRVNAEGDIPSQRTMLFIWLCCKEMAGSSVPAKSPDSFRTS